MKSTSSESLNDEQVHLLLFWLNPVYSPVFQACSFSLSVPACLSVSMSADYLEALKRSRKKDFLFLSAFPYSNAFPNPYSLEGYTQVTAAMQREKPSQAKAEKKMDCLEAGRKIMHHFFPCGCSRFNMMRSNKITHKKGSLTGS